ncbi:Histone H1/H5 [Artemisia annua]|uniref:MYB transcription factor n=1 Tax=Artemisia annua TaxID=35608 RepID=A0A2U1Q306_ARTAN|nr:Histone H1/H5 [Artemisia annua]
MTKHKGRWTKEQDEALWAGVKKYGEGKWKVILSDPQFGPALSNRSNIDLKDKWRNMTVGGGSSSKHRVKTPMLEIVAANLPVNSPEPSCVVLLLDYEAMIFEALCCIEYPNGPDINAILSFINQKFDVPENFKRSMTSKLRRLVFTGELEKVDNRYKYKGASSGFETSQQLVAIPYNVDNNSVAQTTQKSIANPADRETLEDAAMVVARKISITENLEQEAIKACEKADKIAELLDESLVMLKLAKELHERYLSFLFIWQVRRGMTFLRPSLMMVIGPF